jgi:spore coat polysaccharide biosynthesis predicted glycosyltransferase SpsG
VQTIPIIFRCDASSEIGWGYLRRCFALAETAQQSARFRVTFLSRPLPRNLNKKLSEIHANIQTLDVNASLEQDLASLHSIFDLTSRKRIVVCIDQRDWTSECFASLKKDNRILLVAFDHGFRRHYDADFMINPSLEAEEIAYSKSESCEALLGPKFAMVREEIHTLRQHPTERMAENFQFLVTLGAGDRWGHGLKVLEAVKKSPVKFETHFVVTADWPHTEDAKKLIGNHPRVHFYEDPSFFPQLMARADLALTSAGNSTYELAYLGIPMMTLALTPDQQALGEAWARKGCGEHLGAGENLSVDLILDRLHYWMERDQELEDRGVIGQSLVDGRGKFRLLERILKAVDQ